MYSIYDGVRRVSGLRREPTVYVSHWKVDSDPLVRNLYRLRTISSILHRFLTRESEFTFQWDTQICVGSSTETAGFLRNPETWCTPSYVIDGLDVEYDLQWFDVLWRRRRGGRKRHDEHLSIVLMLIVFIFLICNLPRSGASQSI